jgi:hypothetical protein
VTARFVDPMRVAIAAEYATPDALLDAATALRARGYVRLDAYTPYPLDALEDRLAIPRTRLPWLAFAAGVAGVVVGYGLQWFCNVWSYPIPVGGRPIHSGPAFIPITFETTVLFASAATFVGFFLASGLPELWNPLFEVPGFERASVDAFWLAVDGRDERFDAERTHDDVAATHPMRVVALEPDR